MSYWSQNTAASTQLDDLLSKEDVTVQEIMEQPEVLQECKSQNKKLIEYLSRPDVLRELIFLTTREPVGDEEEAIRYKYSSIACELLTCELSQVIQTIASEQSLLEDLFAFLVTEPPLNPLLSSFFSRIMGVLIAKISEQNWFSYQVSCLQVLEFLKSKSNCIELLVTHIGTSAIMDLILKMYTKFEGTDIRDNFLTWLDESEFLEKLLDQLKPESKLDVRSNVCQLICDLIRAHREKTDKQDDDRIAKKIESEEFVKRLLEQMFLEPRCEGSIVGGISVLLTLLGNGRREEYPFASWDAAPHPEASSVTAGTVAAILPHLPHVLDILKNPPQKPVVRTTVGCLNPPLGPTRVEVVRLLAALVATGNEKLLADIQSHDLLNVLLDLFFQYPWNNFLHAQVEATLIAAFKSSPLVTHIFSQCRLMQRVLEAWKDNAAQEFEKKPRKGYMGHLIRIANHIVSESEKESAIPLSDLVDEETLAQWQEFVNTSLAKVNGDQSSGVGFKQKRDNDSEADEFYQELFRRYQLAQTLAPSFEDNFCVEQMEVDDDIGGDINTQSELTSKPSIISMEPDLIQQQRAELFNQVCAQKMQTLDDDAADMWSSIMRNTTDDHDARQWTDETSSDEEDWPETGRGNAAQSEQSNPWSADVLSASSPPDPDQDWANFEASPFLSNFGFDLSSTIATSAPGDLERVPFDLTPTTSDWPDQEPPVDWPVTPPSETPPSDVETPPADKEEAPLSLSTDNTRPTEDVSPKIDVAPAEVKVEDSTNSEHLAQEKNGLERPEVIDCEKLANIVTISELKNHAGDEVGDESTSSSLKLDLSQSNSDDSVIAAFAPATVIKQTEETPVKAEVESLPLSDPSGDVAVQLAELLADVSISSGVEPTQMRGAGDVVNGAAVNAENSTISKITGNDSDSTHISTSNNEGLQAPESDIDLVPNDVTTSILAVKEEEDATPKNNSDPVTAI